MTPQRKMLVAVNVFCMLVASVAAWKLWGFWGVVWTNFVVAWIRPVKEHL